MKRITIERYKNPAEVQSAGLIEGETDDGRRWIMWLDEQGAPSVYWPEREEDGAVVGDPVGLTRQVDKVRQIVGPIAEMNLEGPADSIVIERRADTSTFDVTAIRGKQIQRYEVESSWRVHPLG